MPSPWRHETNMAVFRSALADVQIGNTSLTRILERIDRPDDLRRAMLRLPAARHSAGTLQADLAVPLLLSSQTPPRHNRHR